MTISTILDHWSVPTNGSFLIEYNHAHFMNLLGVQRILVSSSSTHSLKSDHQSPHNHLISLRSILLLCVHLHPGLLSVFFLKAFQPTFCMQFSSPPWMQSKNSPCLFIYLFISIINSHLCLGPTSDSFHSGFLIKIVHTFLISSPLIWPPNSIWWRVQIIT
jgi:hypothetical protein